MRQALRPEAIEPKLFIELTRQPARAPLPRPMQLHCIEPYLHAMCLRVFRNAAIGRKQSQLRVAACSFVKSFDRTTPIVMLAIIDLAEVQNLPLYHFAASTTLVLDDIPIAMLLAVFEAPVESQEHANQLTPNKADEKRLGLHYRRLATAPL